MASPPDLPGAFLKSSLGLKKVLKKVLKDFEMPPLV